MLRKVETEAFSGGFRRRWPGVPQRLPASRDTSLVREVLWRGGTRLVDAARVFGGWVHVLALAEAGWLGPPRASERNSLVETGERLVSIAAHRCTIAQLAGCARGTVAFVTGRVRGARGPAAAEPIWQYQETQYQPDEFFRAEDPWPLPEEPAYVETAHDFLVEDETKGRVLVDVDRAYLVATNRLTVGTAVGVLGFVDFVVDPRGESTGIRAVPSLPVLRSGHALPLLVLVRAPGPHV